jgi:hypothetical protein
MPTDLETAVKCLTAKKPIHDRFFAYYDGHQPLIYSSSKLREIFHRLDANFVENWCSVVVDSLLDRLDLRALVVADDDASTKQLQTLREQSGLIDDEAAIHEDVCVTGEAFVIAWRDDETGDIDAYQNDSRLCHAFYAEDNPHQMRAAAKWWIEDGIVRLNLYYADRIEYYSTVKKFNEGEDVTAKSFYPFGDSPIAENPFGRLNVFHFRSNRRRPKSQLNDVISIQDIVNKTLSDLVVTGEFMAFPQRYVISESGIANGNLQNNPNAIWDLVSAAKESQPTSAGQFPAADLGNYLEVIRDLTTAIGVISRTPKHYFFAQGGDPSGEALIAMEAPLNKKTMRLQQTLSPTWRDLGSFLLILNGIDVASQQIWANYTPPETNQPMTSAQITKTLVEAGMPLQNILRDDGWDAADLQELADDMQAERVQGATFADAVLNQAQRQFDRGEAVV